MEGRRRGWRRVDGELGTGEGGPEVERLNQICLDSTKLKPVMRSVRELLLLRDQSLFYVHISITFCGTEKKTFYLLYFYLGIV